MDMPVSREGQPSALVVEGGAMRGIFAAGVLDTFIEADYLPFDFAIGVSAGSTNLIGYLAGDHGRSRRILLDHARRTDFINWRRYLRGGHFCDVSWLWHASYDEVPLNVRRYLDNNVPLYAVTTSIVTGEACYLRVTEENMHEVFPASCAIPLFYRDFPRVNGEPMTDGGLADSIPVIRAYEQGARDIAVVLSRPLGYRKRVSPAPKFIQQFFHGHARLFEAVLGRAERYNRALEFIQSPPADCRIRVIAPPAHFPVGRFTREAELLEQGYLFGREAGMAHLRGRGIAV
ncbi:patatin-like phospholipase family protein [Microbulbifer thermotolerans]|uniref:Patatin family protein n=1 Tax=Microbulbifer thermotolerans TaxID=252514 RepID=A0A143HKR6_MICTH|nr:patatin family protein [Microbulbifer thermotolerans]AMX02314.1 patatin family protein [Microbulbifer thermotolerans]MCX2780049.1 patatin family protein [Microbulbifer thermotolerans]MCX2795095.1 patatin family protein [Microbulbifer thermotolerans]MCX2801876.1 patatin family protein [Microbulbifer thermotolerans]MCX2805472.1 patatin family protein [Microbulbifer thermotolerans]